jgi:hypothetical protein
MLEYSVGIACRDAIEKRMAPGDTAAQALASPTLLREKESPDRQHRLLLKSQTGLERIHQVS